MTTSDPAWEDVKAWFADHVPAGPYLYPPDQMSDAPMRQLAAEVTREKLDILRRADWILMDEIKKADVYYDMWQSFAVLTDTKSVGVQGDFRTYGHTIALRCVAAEDAMTADWARLPYDLLATISNRITNEVREVNRVVYDITSKPPGTIEWE